MHHFLPYFVYAATNTQVWLCSAALTICFVGLAEAWIKFKGAYVNKVALRAIQNN